MIGCRSDAGDRRDGCKQEVGGGYSRAGSADGAEAKSQLLIVNSVLAPTAHLHDGLLFTPSGDLKDQTGVSVYSGSILTPESTFHIFGKRMSTG